MRDIRHHRKGAFSLSIIDANLDEQDQDQSLRDEVTQQQQNEGGIIYMMNNLISPDSSMLKSTSSGLSLLLRDSIAQATATEISFMP
jgi:hypothetical protein